MTDDTVEGLGKIPFPRNLLGAFFSIAKPQHPSNSLAKPTSHSYAAISHTQLAPQSRTNTFPWDPGERSPYDQDALHSSFVSQDQLMPSETGILTEVLPDPGVLLVFYFTYRTD